MKLWIKIGLVVTTVLAGLVIALLLLVDRSTDDALRDEHEHALVQAAQHIAEDIEQPLRLGAQEELVRRLREQKDRNEQLEYLLVKDGSGKVAAHTFPGEAPRDEDGATGLKDGQDHAVAVIAKGMVSHVAVRVSPGLEGELHIGASERHYREVIGSLHRSVLTTGGIIILLGAAASFSLGYYVMRPLQEVVTGMRTIAAGDLGHRIELAGRDEAAMLAREFNDMAEKRQEAEDQIIEMNFELDERVQQRTAQLEAANREMEAFSYSVSHDLRAPLRSIDGFSKALLDDYSDKLDAEGRDHLKRVRKASQRMGQLIDDILKLSRITRGEMLIEQLDLSAMVREVVKPLAEADPSRKVKVHVQDGVAARGDRKMLRVVLDNLVGNAWKYSGKQPIAWVTFGMAPSNRGTAYFVKDNGAGFDMAFSQKLFTPFQRLHSEKDFPGTGIGLATVQRIIHRHGGEVWAESEPGKGATFYFTLGQERSR